jgi:hypothetical protein
MKMFQQADKFGRRNSQRRRTLSPQEFAMLIFYLPIIIFEAMLPTSKREPDKPSSN